MAQAAKPFITRREALHLAAGAVAVAAIPVAALALPAGGPLARLAGEREALLRSIDDSPESLSEEVVDAGMARLNVIDDEIIAIEADTIPEAFAKLQVAREDFWRFHFAGHQSPDQGQRLVLAAMDDAVRALRPLAS